MNFDLILCLVFSACLSWLFLPMVLKVAFKKNLFDDCEKRKIHVGAVPRLGGVVFVPSVIIVLCFLFGIFNIFPSVFTREIGIDDFSRLALFNVALILLYLEGIVDDLIGLSYKTKLFFQCISASFVVLSGVCFEDFYGLFGIGDLNSYVGVCLSIFIIVYLINALNFIDGIDGVASGLALVAMAFMVGLLDIERDYLFVLISYATMGSLAVFFCFNVFGNPEKHHKTFMGDCGSQTLGLILASLFIYTSNVTNDVEYDIQYSLPLSLGFIFIIFMDMIRVFFWRVFHRKSPFKPNNVHIIHKFLALGIGRRTTMVIVITFQTLFCFVNLFFSAYQININFLVMIDIILWIVVNGILNIYMHRKHVGLPYKA